MIIDKCILQRPVVAPLIHFQQIRQPDHDLYRLAPGPSPAKLLIIACGKGRGFQAMIIDVLENIQVHVYNYVMNEFTT